MSDSLNIPMRTCTSCGIPKPLTSDNFGKQPGGKDGFKARCKVCLKAYNAQYHASHREERRIHHAKYYAEHREKYRAYCHEYAITHRAERRAYEQARPEARRAIRARHRAKHPITQDFYDRHRETRLANVHKRRARKHGNGGSYTPQDIQRQLKAQKNKCYWCSKKLDKFHVDHVVPLSRGGTNDPSNLVIACPPCNMRKHDRMPHEWPEGGRLL